jgi:hypothetical protein
MLVFSSIIYNRSKIAIFSTLIDSSRINDDAEEMAGLLQDITTTNNSAIGSSNNTK